MANKILLTFLGVDLLFLLTGVLLIVSVFMFRAGMNATPSISNVATNLLMVQTPLEGALVNAILIFFTFVLSLPGAFLTTNRAILRVHSWFVIICGLLTLVIGLDVWFATLRTRSELASVWATQSPQEQSLLQQKFDCCGYTSSNSPPFQTDPTCPTPAAAAAKEGCIGPFSLYANQFEAVLFTIMFGIVAIDVITFFSSVVVLKDRAEQERYRHIDEKNGFGTI
ncbi:phospholipid scramblase 1 [Loxospora ochrophaea]|nr:phospholipid scramblase 1 [Loxospora ochrophaea]